MERLTPLAEAFLEAENADGEASLCIGSVAVFEGPAPSFEEFVRAIEGRLPLVPRYRQKLRTVPGGLASPAWVDDPGFDIRWHIRNTALPSPGGQAEVGRLVSRVMSRRMDRSRPLWEYWFVEGLTGGRWALLSKLHHSMADGVSGTDLYRLVLDADREPREPVTDNWAPDSPDSQLSFTTKAMLELARTPVSGIRALTAALTSPVRLARQTGDTVRGLVSMSGALLPLQRSSLTGPLGGGLRYTWTDVSMDDIRRVKVRNHATVNDIALTLVTGGFRHLLLSRGEEPSQHTLRTLVPVSTRAPGAESVTDNQVSLMLPYLPVDLAAPKDRLAAVKKRVRLLKHGGEPEAGSNLTAMAEYGPFLPVALAMRLAFHLPQRQVATVTTNVPGPRKTLYCLGREVQQLLPFVPIADRVRIGVVMFSYRDTLTFGITGDYETAPDIRVLAEGISESMAELLSELSEVG